MTEVFLRVPQHGEHEARDYHDAFCYASMKTDDYAMRVKSTWWSVDNCSGRVTPADAWKRFEWLTAANK